MSYSEPPVQTVQGALIQLFPGKGLAGIANAYPNIVQFDVNPDTLTRSYTPWQPETQAGAPAPGAAVQPVSVPEKFTGLSIILDPMAKTTSLIPANFLSVEARLSALRKMFQPAKGLVGDLLQTVGDLVGADMDYEPPEISPVILWLGTRIVLPVQMTKFDITEHQHDRMYYPTRATVSLDLQVQTPDKFRCMDSPVADIAVAAYNYTKAQQDLSAIASAADLSPLWRLVVPV